MWSTIINVQMDKTPEPKDEVPPKMVPVTPVPGTYRGPKPPTVGPYETTGRDFMARIKTALDLASNIASTMGDLGDYDRDETAAFVRSMEAQVQDWAKNLIARKERNLAELKKVVGELKSSGDKHDERTKQ